MGKGASTINHANLIMITSALPGEGKTFTAVNLAISIAAELDHTVMLVDADVARPWVLRSLGIPEGPGLLDLLDGSAQMHEVLLRTNIDKLSLLPSGKPHPRATEMLASEAMSLLLDDIEKIARLHVGDVIELLDDLVDRDGADGDRRCADDGLPDRPEIAAR